MALPNPFGLTLELGAAEALARDEALRGFASAPAAAPTLPSENPLFAFSDESHLPEPVDFPLDEPEYLRAAAAPGPNTRLRFRDSAVLRTEQVPGFAAGDAEAPPVPQPLTPAAYAPFAGSDDEGEVGDAAVPEAPAGDEAVEEISESEELDEEAMAECIRLNYFVHNGYRYDGDVFELRPPQERSIGSRPGRILEHKPAVLNHRQVFNRVYSEGTYNNRPSSLRQLRLSARLSTGSWASVSELVGESLALEAATAARSARDSLLVVPPPAAYTGTSMSEADLRLLATPERARKRISLLVEHALVTAEQAKTLKVASGDAVPTRAPRLTQHIVNPGGENVDPTAPGADSGSRRQLRAGERRTKSGRGRSRKRTAAADKPPRSKHVRERPPEPRTALAERSASPPNQRRRGVDSKSSSHSSKSGLSVGSKGGQSGGRRTPKTSKRRPFWKSLALN